MLFKYRVKAGHPQEMRLVNQPCSYDVFAESENDALNKAKERHKERFGTDRLINPDAYMVEYYGDTIKGDSMTDISDEQLINMIKDIRSRNNGYWMDILKLAFKHAPDEARELMRNIKKCDQDINDLTEKLTKGDYHGS